MRFVSSALKRVVFPALSRSGYLRYAAGAGPAVVTYHGVFPSGYEIRNAALDGNLVRADSLRLQLELLKKRYDVITPAEFLDWHEGRSSLPPRSILLTCDDGLRNHLTEMVPILREFGVSCLFFFTRVSADEKPSMLWYEELYLMLLDAAQSVSLSLPEAGILTGPIAADQKHAVWWQMVGLLSPFDGELRRGFLGKIRKQLGLADNWGQRFIRDPVLAARFLVCDDRELLQLAQAGMSIGAHTLSHPILARVSEEIARREIAESKVELERLLGQPVWALAYPFGDAASVTGREARLAEEAGFRCAFMNVGGGFGAEMKRFAVPRVHVTADMGLGEFEAHISGFYRSLRRRFRGDNSQP